MKRLLIIIIVAFLLSACDPVVTEESAAKDIFAEDTATAVTFPEDRTLQL